MNSYRRNQDITEEELRELKRQHKNRHFKPVSGRMPCVACYREKPIFAVFYDMLVCVWCFGRYQIKPGTVFPAPMVHPFRSAIVCSKCHKPYFKVSAASMQCRYCHTKHKTPRLEVKPLFQPQNKTLEMLESGHMSRTTIYRQLKRQREAHEIGNDY